MPQEDQKIVVTPEMIEAGMDEFYSRDIEDDGARVVLSAVYLAMRALEHVDNGAGCSDEFL